MEFRSALDRIFATDCAQGGAVEASSTWHHNPRYEVSHLLDDTYDNYWAANETDTTAVITLRLGEPRTFNRILLQEYIPLGQRVARFHVDALDDKGEWQELARETTIGYKRILLCEPTQTTALRISIDEAFAPPILNRLALYYDDVVLDDPYAERDKRGYIRFTSPSATAQIRYTLDGTTPTATSQLYSKPIYQPAPCRLRAVAFDGQKSSGVVHYDWDVTPASFRVLNPSSAEAIVDGLSDDGADSLTRGAVLATAQAVVVDLAKTYTLTGFYYEPLLRGRYGCLQSYDLSCSNDGTTWQEVLVDASFDNIVNSPTRREVRFDTPIRCRYLRLVPRTTTGGEQYGMGEIGIRTK
jgi:alpha-L-fucosidase